MYQGTRFATVLNLSSFLILIYSITMLLPVLVALVYHEDDYFAFVLTFAATFTAGGLGLLVTRKVEPSLRTRDGFLVVVLFWVILSTMSAAPFLVDRNLRLGITDALFEAISGITTTGASVLSDIDGQPRSILYYRAQLNYLGGLGIIVLAVAVLPLLGVGGAKLYQSETPGPMKEERLTPRLADTAKHLWRIYVGLAALCTLSFHLAGMNWFDSLCHSLSTMSLGGFSPHADSLGYYHSQPIEIVGGIFSILAGVNFALYFLALRRRSLMPVIGDPEFRFFILIATLVVSITCFELYRTHTFNLQDALVHGFFQAISIMADNGLVSANYPAWPPHIVLLLLGMSFFGASVGSTCGGIKAMRFLLLYRQSEREVRQLIHPNAVITTKVGQRRISDRVIWSVWGLFFLYVFLACAFIWALVAAGNDLDTAFGTVAACMNNMGVGYGATSTGFGGLNDVSKWLMCAAMLFGRLEVFPILVVFSTTFWRF